MSLYPLICTYCGTFQALKLGVFDLFGPPDLKKVKISVGEGKKYKKEAAIAFLSSESLDTIGTDPSAVSLSRVGFSHQSLAN